MPQVRTKDKMADQRSHFIEELLRADPAYRHGYGLLLL